MTLKQDCNINITSSNYIFIPKIQLGVFHALHLYKIYVNVICACVLNIESILSSILE